MRASIGEEMNDQDLKTIQTMIRFGGSFVSNLGKAALCADANNLQKIKDAFPEYWKQYTEMAEHR
jgi:hypothetical protein